MGEDRNVVLKGTMDKEGMDFEQRFEQKVVELLVLIKENVGGAAVYGKYLRPFGGGGRQNQWRNG